MADVEKIGSVFQINATTTGIQFTPAVSALRNGGFVVAWTDFNSGSPDDTSGSAVRAQLYDSQGFRVGGEFRVNTLTALSQGQPDIATLDDGTFVIVWQHEFSATDTDLKAQRYSEAGVPIGGEFVIANTGAFDEFQASITAQTGGRYLVTWGQDNNIINFVQKDANGITVSGPGPVAPAPHGTESEASVTALVNGTYVTAYVSNGEIIQRQLVGAGPGTQVNTTTFNPQRSPTVQALEGGGYVVVWVDDAGSPNTPFVLGQRYNAAGFKVGGEFIVNTGAESVDFTTPKVAALVGGGFFVVWDDRNLGFRGQAFDENGVKFGGVLQITPSGVAGSFGAADITVRADGDVVVVWGGNDAGLDGGIEGQVVRIVNKEFGGAGNDTLFGAFSALKPGTEASDILQGFGGNDKLEGGGGAADTLDGGTGLDSASYEGAGAPVTADLQIPAFNNGVAIGDTYISIENLIGSFFGDQLLGNQIGNVISGRGGDDNISGRVGNDTLFGESGEDFIEGGDGNDIILGGFDVDNIEGGNGNDTIYVKEGEFSDNVDGGNDIDTLALGYITSHAASVNLSTGFWNLSPVFGGVLTITGIENVGGTQLNDTIAGSVFANLIGGAAGNDRIYGFDGNDTIVGADGNDTLVGGVGNDVINGNNGNDTIVGDVGNDVLRGDAGFDLIVGSGGFDQMYADAGAATDDVFRFDAISDSAVGALRDRIFDFQAGSGDKINVFNVDANTLVAGNQAFIFGGAFVIGHARVVISGANSIVQFNNDGDAAPDMEIYVNGTIALGAVDFVL